MNILRVVSLQVGEIYYKTHKHSHHECFRWMLTYHCHQDSHRHRVGWCWSWTVQRFLLMWCSGSLQNLLQAEDDEDQQPRAPGGSFCSPLSCDCGCFLCMETFCERRSNYRDEDAAGLQWPRAAGCVCWWNFSLRGVLAFRCPSHRQR